MKSRFVRIAGVLTILLAFFTIGTAFMGKSTFSADDDNSCIVIVKYSGGSVAESIKVASDVCGGISCSGGRTFYTDKEGKANVKWVKGCKLCAIYVKGTEHKGVYENGKTYTFTLD